VKRERLGVPAAGVETPIRKYRLCACVSCVPVLPLWFEARVSAPALPGSAPRLNVLLKPQPFHEPGRLVALYHVAPGFGTVLRSQEKPTEFEPFRCHADDCG